MGDPSAPSVEGDPCLAGLKMAEQMQTLKVACERSPTAAPAYPPPGAAPKEGGDEAPEGLYRDAPEVSPGLPPEPVPSWVALRGSGVEGGGLCKPFVAISPSSVQDASGEALGDCSDRTCAILSLETMGQPVPSLPEGVPSSPPQAPLGRGNERCPAEEVEAGLQQPSSALCGSKSEGLNGQTASVGPEEHDGLSESKPKARRDEKDSLPAKDGRRSASSSESESDSESDSSSSASSCLPMLSDDEDRQDKNENNSCATKKKTELSKQEPLPIEDVMIILPESVELLPFGKVSSIIEHLVIIESQKGLPPVNENTILFKENHHSIGKIFEIFGPVSHPFYILQFNSPEHIHSKAIEIQDTVYFAPNVESFTQYIFPEKLKQEKGSDASWKNDEEPPPEALDFSDDEKERTAKLQKKSQNLRRKKLRLPQNDNKGNGTNYQSRQQHPLEYASGYCRGQPNTRSPHLSPFPSFYRQQNMIPQYYSPDYTEMQKPTFCQQTRMDSLSHQYYFPPPSFETVGNKPNFPPPPTSVTWGWPHGGTQNIYEPLLSMLSLPPPPPPPLPPTAPNSTSPP